MNRHAIRLGGIKHFHSLTEKRDIRKFRDQVERALNKPADRVVAVQVMDFLLKRFDLVGKVCEIEGDYHGVLIRDEVLKRFPPSDNVGNKHPAHLVWPMLGSVPAPPSPEETEVSPEQSILRKRKEPPPPDSLDSPDRPCSNDVAEDVCAVCEKAIVSGEGKLILCKNHRKGCLSVAHIACLDATIGKLFTCDQCFATELTPEKAGDDDEAWLPKQRPNPQRLNFNNGDDGAPAPSHDDDDEMKDDDDDAAAASNAVPASIVATVPHAPRTSLEGTDTDINDAEFDDEMIDDVIDRFAAYTVEPPTELANLTAANAQLTADLTTKEATIASLNSELEQLRDALASKDETISSLHTNLETQEQQTRDVLRSLHSKQTEIDKAKHHIKRLVKAMQDSTAKPKTGQTKPYMPSPDV